MEIEAKILEVDAESVEERLRALGASLVFDGEHEALHFTSDDFDHERNTLRIRKEKWTGTGALSGNERSILTLKTDKSTTGTKNANEYETEVGDYEAAKRILEGLGYRSRGLRKKHRKEFCIGEVHFCLDTLHDGRVGKRIDLPTYLEIEAPSEAEVIAWAERLGYSKDDLKPWTLRNVLEYYRVMRRAH